MTTSPLLPPQHGDALARHVRLVDLVAAVAPPTPSWSELRCRYGRFVDLLEEVPLRERLVNAVVTGDDAADIPAMRALALAEAGVGSVDVMQAVRASVYPRLVEYYGKSARGNYAKVAKQFDTTATEFAAAARAGDPEADANELLDQPEEVRRGWLDAQIFAGKLDGLVPVLCAAAQLCGAPIIDDSSVLPLCCDPVGQHRRRLWEAWRAEGGRTGRWGALAALGARIRAAGLDGFEAYREPKPLIRKQFPVGGPDGRGVYRPEFIDPEDEDYRPPVEEQPKRRALAR